MRLSEDEKYILISVQTVLHRYKHQIPNIEKDNIEFWSRKLSKEIFHAFETFKQLADGVLLMNELITNEQKKEEKQASALQCSMEQLKR